MAQGCVPFFLGEHSVLNLAWMIDGVILIAVCDKKTVDLALTGSVWEVGSADFSTWL